MGRTKRPSFSLVELLIAVLILGALTTIAIPKITGSIQTANANACKNNIQIINNQIELYYINTGEWPTNLKTVTTNTNYFLDGEPICPITGETYPNNLLSTNRVDASGHNH
jgi:type II secretory pathway pseudopilin PulG